MAARIPGFDFYVQHHVTQIAGDNGDIAFEGIAVVRFASEADRDAWRWFVEATERRELVCPPRSAFEDMVKKLL